MLADTDGLLVVALVLAVTEYTPFGSFLLVRYFHVATPLLPVVTPCITMLPFALVKVMPTLAPATGVLPAFRLTEIVTV